MNHKNNFHLLRHIASLMVVIEHCLGPYERFNHFEDSFIRFATLSVGIFFVISGFLVVQSLLNSKTRIEFIKKRLLRLWPALFVVTFLMVFIVGALITTLPLLQYFNNYQTWRFFFRNIFFLPVYILPGVLPGDALNGTFWSLFFEMICYILLFIVGKNFFIKHARLILFGWLVFVCLKYFSDAGSISINIPSNYFWNMIFRMVFLFFTASLWSINRNAIKIKSPILIITSIIIFFGLYYFQLPFQLNNIIQNFSLVIFITEFGRSKAIIKWPSWDISYGIFLIAYPVQMCLKWFVFKHTAYGIDLLFATLLITLPLAILSWIYIEKPALRLKKL